MNKENIDKLFENEIFQKKLVEFISSQITVQYGIGGSTIVRFGDKEIFRSFAFGKFDEYNSEASHSEKYVLGFLGLNLVLIRYQVIKIMQDCGILNFNKDLNANDSTDNWTFVQEYRMAA